MPLKAHTAAFWWAVAGWAIAIILAASITLSRLAGSWDDQLQWGSVGEWIVAIVTATAIGVAVHQFSEQHRLDRQVRQDELDAQTRAEERDHERQAEEQLKLANLVTTKRHDVYTNMGPDRQLASIQILIENHYPTPIYLCEARIVGPDTYLPMLSRKLGTLEPSEKALRVVVQPAMDYESKSLEERAKALRSMLGEDSNKGTGTPNVRLVFQFTDLHRNVWLCREGEPAKKIYGPNDV